MHLPFLLRRRSGLILLSLSVWSPHLKAAEFVKITAEIRSLGYRLGDSASAAAAKPRVFQVVCTVGAKQWRIENGFTGDMWVFDGTNVYCLSHTKGRNQDAVEVWPSRDGNPMGDFGVNLPWLAFCSGTYLRREGRLIPLPAALLRHSSDRFAYADTTTTFKDEFGLPRTVDLFTSKARFLASSHDYDKEQFFGERYAAWEARTAAQLQEGLLMFHYAVLESTNYAGWSIPTRFEFFQSGRPYEENGDWVCEGSGRVQSIDPASKPEGVLVAGVRRKMFDFRFRDPKARLAGITYTSADAALLPTSSPKLRAELKWPMSRLSN